MRLMINGIKHSDIISRFLVIQCTIAVFIAVFIIYIFSLETKNNVRAIESSEQYNVKIQGREIGAVFKSIVSDISYLSRQSELHEFLMKPAHKEVVARDWVAFSKKREVYEQIRFIKSSGMEAIRVHLNNREPLIIPDKNLRNMTDAYYFKETLKLDRDGIFVSRFLVNTAYDKPEVPPKPIIRIGAPVIDAKGTKKGVVIIDYLGERIINNLRQNLSQFQSYMMLLNPEGYWLIGMMPQKEYNAAHKNITFRKDFPDAWDVISTKEDGQFYDEKGLFTFNTVFGLSGKGAIASGPGQDADHAGREGLSWKLISYMPNDRLTALNKPIRSNLTLLYFFLFIVTAFVSWPLSQISLKRKRAEEDLKAAYSQLERKIEERTRDLLHANLELEREVVDRKKAEEVKESLIRHKDLFINQLGHDLKTPLTVLVTLLPLMEKQERDPKIQRLLNVCSKNVTYMKDLIIKTIKLARADSASKGMHMESVPLLKAVNSYLDKMDFIINEKKLKLENRIPPDVTVSADKTELEELFYNLISNAVKYTPENGSVVIDAGRGETESVTVSVQDTGIGLSEKHIEHIFQEFYKVDESRHELDSSGLGLSICRKIVENHGGRIWAESPGEKLGSTFYFTLQA